MDPCLTLCYSAVLRCLEILLLSFVPYQVESCREAETVFGKGGDEAFACSSGHAQKEPTSTVEV